MLNKFKVNNELQCLLVTYKTERWIMLACNWTWSNSFPPRFLNRIKGNFDKNEFNITKIEIQQWLKSTWIFFCFIQFCCCLVLFVGKGCPCAQARMPFTVGCPLLPYFTPTVLNHSIRLSPGMFKVEHSFKIRVCL